MTPYTELRRRAKESATLASCGAVLNWDEHTYLPTAGANFRSDQMALIARLTHEMSTDPKVGELLDQVEASDVMKNPSDAANIREMRRSYNRAVKLPKRLVEELAKLTSQAQCVWAEARSKNDFAMFRPWLEKIVTLKREEAQAVGYQEHPYDALLDEYEPGATAAVVREAFADLKKNLTPLIAAIAASSKKPKSEILHREYPVDQQETFGKMVAGVIGFDFTAGRLDTTTHPFCTGIGPGDCRITTRYNPRFFNESFFGIMHEAGHGIYEQGLNREFFGEPLGGFCSLGIHESQSRLWENQVGRGKAFWTHFYPLAQMTFMSSLMGTPLDDFYFAINEVKPSFIRVEADEATYNLHIILRFELELALLTGDLAPADLPGAWNERFAAMFPLTVPDDKMGCLQDIHWSMGGIGYFPTYTLGNLYAAQFMAQAKQDIVGLEEEFARGEFSSLKSWLNEKIHKPGRQFVANELCRNVTGEPLKSDAFMKYLRDKFGALYSVSVNG